MGNVVSDLVAFVAGAIAIAQTLSGKIDAFTYIASLSIAILCFFVFMRGILIITAYRLSHETNGLDLPYSRIRSRIGDSVRLFVQKEYEDNMLKKLLKLLRYKLIVVIDPPPGVKVKTEEFNSDFKEIEHKEKLVLAGDIDLRGRREIILYVQVDSDSTTFRGNDSIFIRIYVAPQNKYIMGLLSQIGSQGYSKVLILPDV